MAEWASCHEMKKFHSSCQHGRRQREASSVVSPFRYQGTNTGRNGDGECASGYCYASLQLRLGSIKVSSPSTHDVVYDEPINHR